jgi:soluble lytic murein transglycosylase
VVDLTISVRVNFAKTLMHFLLISLLSSPVMATIETEIKRCGDKLKKSLNGDSTITITDHQCPLSISLHQWALCQRKAPSFETIRQFLTTHPDWPRQDTIRQKAEDDLANFIQPPQEIVRWFTKFPPLTGKGACVYMRALQKTNAQSLSTIANKLLQSVSFSSTDLEKFLQANHQFLNKDDLFNKANGLLDKQEDLSLLPLLMPYLSHAQKKIISARQQPNQAMLLTPNSHAGLILDQIRLNRKSDQTQVAVKLLKELKEIPTDQAESFWVEQNILARRLIEEKRMDEAYQLIDKHHLIEGENFANAEWLAGWLSLRFLNKPSQALMHFQQLRDKVKSPISVARANYWLGRTYKSLKDSEAATNAFRKAAVHLGTYYGQLAGKELHGKIHPVALKKPVASAETRQKFEKRSLTQIIHLLLALKETSPAEAFAISLGKQLKTPSEQVLLIDLMHEKGNKYLGVQIAKKSTTTSSPLTPAAYPKLLEVQKGVANTAFSHAIIRQESRFKADAVSSAGALGLMQLMPATADKTVKKHKLKKGSLTHAATNVSIGTRHLKDLVDRFGGSMILAAAAYNAGVNAVENWLITFGDPRNPSVDAIDWVELIPYFETRNYVQRVLENYYCYIK